MDLPAVRLARVSRGPWRRTVSGNKNWIAGAWRPSASGHSFNTNHFGAWPRSDGMDVAAALAGIEEASASWRSQSPAARADGLGEVLDYWEDAGELEEEFATCLDLLPSALWDARKAALALGDEYIARPRDLGPRSPTLARAAAGGLGSALVRCVFPALLEGRGVLLLSDADAPLVATLFAELFDAAGFPPGLLALLHDDASTSARAALASQRLGQVALAEPEDRAQALVRIASESSVPPPGWAGAQDLSPPGELDWQITPTRQRAALVLLGDDPQAAARAVCRQAFGPALPLSGQGTGAVGRVYCHEQHFSAFTSALLDAVDRLERPGMLFDSGLASHIGRISQLGLDEGATLIRGAYGAFTGSRRRMRDAILVPSVFTNVEPLMALAKTDRPAPVLSLLRVTSDSEAQELERALPSAAFPSR
jgi:acyl-CoA reductase-like NAD-dependent aldehyde dehydrogenase